MVWSRPPGDPRVWSIVETVKADGKKVKFIIQEIPPNRYAEALDHLCTVFISSEPACRSIKLIDDAESVAEIRAFWTTALNHGISIGVYEADENNQISKFAGMNVLVMGHKDEDKTITPIKASLFLFRHNTNAEEKSFLLKEFAIDSFHNFFKNMSEEMKSCSFIPLF
ncbi:Protein of unknown function [Cotesia congregata]|uniref:Uncharacterized protein n=1 Tax=Cotesia congregata TaxID=51543 RepID=A0A8J2H853_COTCN|nr:Protein of unknown function [Cotesia congregata]